MEPSVKEFSHTFGENCSQLDPIHNAQAEKIRAQAARRRMSGPLAPSAVGAAARGRQLSALSEPRAESFNLNRRRLIRTVRCLAE
ncbi:hypothetical protein EVAR_43351_1 [Eumeta japonica]|uniref:Uncharacterized protein n=1 Tax=Eumeta variegata TaxID=151549 RepID=A0A4C1WSF6_EUMVA|nr:hypothetical protein EVAR_43351_1 [Eumeta japonica]